MPTTVRLPAGVEQMLTEYCLAHHKTQSEVIVEALDKQERVRRAIRAKHRR